MGFAERLRALMDERGLSGNALARKVPCNPAYISRLASGKQQPSRNIVRRLDDALGAGGELVALASAARNGTQAAQETVMVPCRTRDGRIIFVDVPRRLFLQGSVTTVAAITASLAAPGAPPPDRPSERFLLARKVLRDSDNLFGPRQVIPAATRQTAAVAQAVRQARGADHRELMRIQAQFADLIGWLHQDSGDWQAARHWLDRALEWAHLAGDPGSVAFILARKGQLAADTRGPAEAVALAEAALRLAAPRTKVAAAAAAYAAHGHALAGERSASARLYDQARDMLGCDGGESPWWAAFCDHAYIGVQQAHSLAMLGDHKAAADGVRRAIIRLQPGYHRDRGVYLAREAVAYAGAGELEHAAGLGMQALAIGAETLSGRIFSELATLDQMFSARPAPGAAERFRAALDAAILRQE